MLLLGCAVCPPSAYPFPSAPIAKALVDAYKRGVRVKVIRRDADAWALHVDEAGALGLAAGDWALIHTPPGHIRQRVHRSAVGHPRMGDVQHGWWLPERSGTDPELFGVVEANLLCPDAAGSCSREIGGWPHPARRCRVEPAGGNAPGADGLPLAR